MPRNICDHVSDNFEFRVFELIFAHFRVLRPELRNFLREMLLCFQIFNVVNFQNVAIVGQNSDSETELSGQFSDLERVAIDAI